MASKGKQLVQASTEKSEFIQKSAYDVYVARMCEKDGANKLTDILRRRETRYNTD